MRRAWRELRGNRLSPARGAAAVALGIFIGSQPIFGCHTPLVLALCLWLRLDAAIMWVASNISNPFFAPVLLTAEVQMGAYLRTGAAIRFDQEASRLAASELLVRYGGFAFMGAPVVGLALAAIGGAVTFGGIALKRALLPDSGRVEPYRLPSDAPPWLHAVERVAMRYAPVEAESTSAQRARFHYARTKLMGDPVARLVAGIAGESRHALGEVLDIGTGRGQIPILLLELGRVTRANGVDWDAAKIEAAREAAGENADLPELEARFVRGDAREAEFEPADTVLLIDLLHYFTPAEQDSILERAAAAVRPGGRLLVREADTERGWRSWVTLLEERFFTAVRFNRGERVHFRGASEVVRVLEGLGLSCEVRPAWGKTPFSNVLIVATRPSTGGVEEQGG